MEDLKITGEVEDIIYRNKDNGYTVFSLTTEDDEVTCVGVVPQIHSGEALEIHGSWPCTLFTAGRYRCSITKNPCRPPRQGWKNIFPPE